MNGQKQLYRVEDGKIFSGVCAGLARYFNMDVGLVRVTFTLALVLSGFLPIVVEYVVMAMILPYEKDVTYKSDEFINKDDYTINEDDYKY